MIHVVLGVQWGDEGKGKFVDIYSQKADFIVRFHGGNNAGHTVINKYGKFPLHLVPAGIFNPKATAIIGNGTVLDLEVLTGEIEMVEKVLPGVKKRLFISPRCHIIMPYHKLLDRLYEEAKGKAKTGTTGRGIGPVYADKVSYHGIRLYDLFDKKFFKDKLELALGIKNKIIVGLGEKPLNFDQMYAEKLTQFAKIKKLIVEPFPLLHKAVAQKKYLLFEGAHGLFLDNDWGTYPFVTASSCVVANITAGSGVPAQLINRVTGVVKAYTTRVGSGPFPTELLDATGEKIRTAGAEFGTTTGRPRRCGWLDLELIKFAVQLNGITEIALTKLDVLDGFKEIKICTGYTYRGKKVSYIDGDARFLSLVRPVYKTMKGWNTPIDKIRKFTDLPSATKNYIQEIEKQAGVKVKMISVGPSREQTIVRN
jgi:adenylosuccinate synthase